VFRWDEKETARPPQEHEVGPKGSGSPPRGSAPLRGRDGLPLPEPMRARTVSPRRSSRFGQENRERDGWSYVPDEKGVRASLSRSFLAGTPTLLLRDERSSNRRKGDRCARPGVPGELLRADEKRVGHFQPGVEGPRVSFSTWARTLLDGLPGAMDLLTAVLRELDIRSSTPWRAWFPSPWAAADTSGARRVYAVIDGRCEVLASGHPRGLLLGPGDVAVLPTGEPHELRSPVGPWPGTVPVGRLVEAQRAQRWGDAGPDDTRLVGATFSLAAGLEHPVVARLPAAILLRVNAPAEARSAPDCISRIVRELGTSLPASALVAERLMETVVLEALRAPSWCLGPSPGWLRAARDPLLATALARIHAEPQRRWTVAALAAETGRARAPFAARFRHALGITPRAFVDQVRLHRARTLIAAGRLGLDEVAHAVGFGSPRALRRAFLRATGMTPGAYRRSITGPPAPSAPGPRAEPTGR